MSAPADFQPPSTRPVDKDQLLDLLHETMIRANTAWFSAVSCERAYESRRAKVVEHYVAGGQSPSTAERLARTDSTCLDLAHHLVDARADVTRLERFIAHWQFLITHTP